MGLFLVIRLSTILGQVSHRVVILLCVTFIHTHTHRYVYTGGYRYMFECMYQLGKNKMIIEIGQEFCTSLSVMSLKCKEFFFLVIPLIVS